MAIRKPSIERRFVSTAALRFEPNWDGSCSDCGYSIALDEPYWDWHFGPRTSLYMHLGCFETWAPRIAKAAGELK